MSSTEAEYMGCSAAAKEALYLRQLFQELNVFLELRNSEAHPQSPPTTIFADNQGAFALSKNPKSPNTKHIDV